MKRIALISALFITTYSHATINAIVSITPQKTFLSQIAKDKVNITVMVNPSISVHTYEPKPSDMKKITKADIYFGIGVEFEEHWLDKFKALNANMTISDTSKDINKLTSIKHDSHHEKHRIPLL